jgi:MerR family mercuric resistance operon transcriptional regulator
MLRGLTSGQLAKAAGVNIETVRYYEKIKLMPLPPRAANGRRVYDTIHLKRLAFIRRSRELGFGIEEIRALIGLSVPQEGRCAEAKDIAVKHLEDVQAKLADLRKLEAILATTISLCTEDIAAPCPVLNMLETK